MIPGISAFLDLIFPPRCAGCGAYTAGEALCSACCKKIPIAADVLCIICRARLPEGKKICHFSAPCTLGAAAPYSAPEVRSLVRSLKFSGGTAAARPLGEMLALHLLKSGVSPSGATLVPVPLGKRRRRIRGYNQAELIAEVLAQYFGLPLFTDLLLRTRETRKQSTLRDAGERSLNVAGAFAAKSAAPRRIFLIDDVATSGSTLLAAASALKESGAKEVRALAAARA